MSAIKFPRIPYQNDADLRLFLNTDIVITEKLDGLNVLLHDGNAYTRDDSGRPHFASYMAMVNKHHTWKTVNDALYYWGEDLYARHSCEYDAIPEAETYRLFMVATDHLFAFPWALMLSYARRRDLKVVPVLFRGKMASSVLLNQKIKLLMQESSSIGGEREGVVVRVASGFRLSEIHKKMFKVVRDNHVQPDSAHWRRHWRKRKIIWGNSHG